MILNANLAGNPHFGIFLPTFCVISCSKHCLQKRIALWGWRYHPTFPSASEPKRIFSRSRWRLNSTPEIKWRASLVHLKIFRLKTSWWFQPIWKICSSNISSNRDEHLKPPPRKGKSSEPNLHDLGFQPLILSKVSGISTVILVGWRNISLFSMVVLGYVWILQP